jgi:hypothetical protein
MHAHGLCLCMCLPWCVSTRDAPKHPNCIQTKLLSSHRVFALFTPSTYEYNTLPYRSYFYRTYKLRIIHVCNTVCNTAFITDSVQSTPGKAHTNNSMAHIRKKHSRSEDTLVLVKILTVSWTSFLRYRGCLPCLSDHELQ